MDLSYTYIYYINSFQGQRFLLGNTVKGMVASGLPYPFIILYGCTGRKAAGARSSYILPLLINKVPMAAAGKACCVLRILSY